MAVKTFLCPPGTKQTAPKISKAAILVLMLSQANERAIMSILDECDNTCARPVCKYF
jgi:hypothetical protein